MRLCSFAVATPLGPLRRIGLATPQGILDATAARAAFLERRLPATAAQRIAAAEVPPDMLTFLGTGPLAMEWLAEAAEAVLGAGTTATAGGQMLLHEPNAVTLLAPVPRPPGIACFVTWKAHIEEAAAKGFALKWPEPGSEIRPYYKANPDAVAGPGTPLRLPGYAAALDVECEMAAIVGLGGKDLTVDEARRAIAGYCIFNDVSIRDIQKREMEFGLGPTKGKDQDAGNILGPWLVTADEVGDPRGLRMSLHVNDEEWSAYNTARMEWSFAELLASLSQGQTIQPGQVVTSGSYPGGSAMDLGRFLKPGDLVELRIDRLGSLINQIAPA
jgi:2-keto-4-pentenoate hydratase/2-oxohepta-3-ene-1,7-dioic acid hydratase in catechol pathway